MNKKLSFKEKNKHLHLLKDESMFDKDYALFKECRPRSKLHNDLWRITRFNKSGLYERMLFELLDYATPEEIITNRWTSSLPDLEIKTQEQALDKDKVKNKVEPEAKKTIKSIQTLQILLRKKKREKRKSSRVSKNRLE